MALPAFQSRSRRFAEGGAAPTSPQGGPAAGPPAGPQGGGPSAPGGAGGPPQAGAPDPGQQLQAAVQQYAQSKDPQLAVQIADMLVTMMGAGGGAGAPGDPAAAGGGAPAPDAGADQGAQMNRKGGKIPAFGNKGKGGAKPAFGPPAPAAKAAPAAAKGAPAGKPMDALQKLRAKQAGPKK